MDATSHNLLAEVSSAILFLSISYFLYRVYYRLGAEHLPADLPWANGSRTWLDRVRSNYRDSVDFRSNLQAGYDKYGRHGKPFVLPRSNFKPMVMLPFQQLEWLASQGLDAVNGKEPQSDVMSLKYIQTVETMHSGNPANWIHETAVRKDLNRQLGKVLPDITDEMEHALVDYLGTDTSKFVDVNIGPLMVRAIGRATNRTILGKEFARNERFITLAEEYAATTGGYGMWLPTVCPDFLHPVVGPLVMRPVKKVGRELESIMLPVITRRVQEFKQRRVDPESMKDVPEPNDFLQWVINGAADSGKADELRPDKLCVRFSMLEFVSLHTTGFTMTNALFDIASGDEQTVKSRWAALRAEVEDALREDGGQWSRQTLGKLFKIDSAIKESMRCNTLGNLVGERKVVARDGVILPTGEHLPYGTMMAMGQLQQNDERYYESPEEYRPFRFAEMREALGSNRQSPDREGSDVEKNVLMKKSVDITQIGERFLNFGHGRHACPGRFFASQELKVLLATMVMNYDIEPLPVRPPCIWISTNCVPPMEATLRIRRRNA